MLMFASWGIVVRLLCLDPCDIGLAEMRAGGEMRLVSDGAGSAKGACEMLLAKVLVASVAVGLGLATTAAASPSQSSGGTLFASGNGAEKVSVSCATEYGDSDGQWNGPLFTPDTPAFIPIQPEFGPYFAYGTGTAVFTPNGNFNVTCHGTADLTINPTFSGGGSCFAVRGGDQYAHGSKSYNGTGELIVSDDGSVTIGCHGSFVGILP
jgi:hypothetical protein